MALVDQTAGGYRFVPSTNTPYSGGAIALPGFEVVHATLRRSLPWREGFRFVERHLASLGRPRAALCAIELRCAKPYAPEQWLSPGSFNQEYLGLLRGWDIFVEGLNPVARTNVAPVLQPPADQVLYAFSYTIPTTARGGPPTFVVAGSAESPEVRRGEASPEAIRDKTASVMATIQGRLSALGGSWEDVTDVGVYTVHDFSHVLESEILRNVGPAAGRGIRWYYTRPPIDDREVEIDARGVRQDVLLSP
jgi:hypothetical protein